MQEYLGKEYPPEKKVASGGDQLTCERQAAAVRHMMDGDTPKDRLQLLEPQLEDWHSLVCMQVIWKTLYGQTSRDHGTLGYFKSLLNRTTVKNDPKKEVNASLEFLLTVVKGHILAVACEVLGVTKLDSPLQLPPGLREGDSQSQLSFLRRLALQVVDRCTLVGAALTRDKVVETQDGVYNYARVLCHFGALVMEFLDAWAEGDGDRMYCCYRLFLPHFIIANCRKYSLEVLRLQTQVKAMLSPHLAHHILWDRFINTKGGMGNNIPCNLHNEHINKLLKGVIANMGSNLTEVALRRAAQSVSFIQSICHGFDRSSGVPFGTHAHSTRTEEKDVARVVSTVLYLFQTGCWFFRHTSQQVLGLAPGFAQVRSK